jgi:hypothetical protein
MSQSIKDLVNEAAALEDQTVDTGGTGDFEYTPPEAGITIGRFVEYIELGKREQKPFQGKSKPDADEVFLGFELLHPKKNIKTNEESGEKYADFIRLRLTKKLSDRAKFKKLFGKMAYGRADIKHMAQMLGEAFIITIHHNVVEKDGKKITYANMYDANGEFTIGAPFKVDPLTEEKQAIPVPDNIRPLRVFLWTRPTKVTWDSLFIDGTREVKKSDGTVEHVSKNWMQELIMSAKDFKGSALQALINEVDDLPITEDKKPGNAVATQAEKTGKTTKSPSDDNDDLAALGLK